MYDSHAHLAARLPFPEHALPGVLERAWDAGLAGVIVPAGAPEEIDVVVALAASDPRVFGLIGYHPEHAGAVSLRDVAGLRTILETQRSAGIVGIGEAGIDFYWKDDQATRDAQVELCAAQVELAAELDLPISIHLRDKEGRHDAVALLHRILDRTPARVVLHSCTLLTDDLAALLDRGCVVSFSGILSFRSAGALRDAARTVPRDRLLVETDAPFLAPVPHRGQPSEPAFAADVARALAAARGEPFPALWATLGENTVRTFALDAERGA